ncbi:MAG: adenosine deaminase [Parvibaculaceae bacterium]
MKEVLTGFIAGLPKAELHVHIEGTLTPDLKRTLAGRNNIDLGEKTFATLSFPSGAPADAKAAKSLNLQQYRTFLDHYFAGLKVLLTTQDFRDITYDYLRICHDENIRYVELSFDPQAHSTRGLGFGTVADGIIEGCREGERDFGVRSNLIMCITRDLPAEAAMQMLDDAKPYRDHIIGLGLDSVEEGNPPVKFQRHYDRARAEGYRLTAHCDVDMFDAVKHIRQCIDDLKVERIDHGINTIDDERLVDAARERDICLTACPTWRISDPAPRRVDRIRRMYDLGLKVTVNSDDPGYFKSGTMNTMLPPVAAEGSFTKEEMGELMINAFDAAWLPRHERDAYIKEVRAYVASH